MSDRAYFSLIGLAALVLFGLSLVWPQGLGARSPGPFGHQTAAEAARAKPKLRGAEPLKPKKPGLL